jgi:hypothetical protein
MQTYTQILLLTQVTEGINSSKVSEIKPFLEIIARQQNLNLNRLSQFKKAVFKLKLSIINN